MIRMPTVIRYHAHCMDGIVSAALAARAWGARRFVPYTHASPGALPDIIDGAIGVDIPYIPGMRRWIDHHASGLKYLTSEALRSVHRTVDCAVTFDPSAPACVTLLPAPAAFRSLIAMVTRIDSSAFSSASAALDLSDPVLLLTATVNRLHDDAIDRVIIDQLTRRGAERTNPIPALLRALPKGATDDTIAHRATLRAFLQRHARVRHDVLACDLLDLGNRGAHFLAYATFPDTAISVLLITKPHETDILLGRNPWHRGRTPDLAALALAYGGGGHANAAGITFGATPAERTHARAVFRAVVRKLRSAPPA